MTGVKSPFGSKLGLLTPSGLADTPTMQHHLSSFGKLYVSSKISDECCQQQDKQIIGLRYAEHLYDSCPAVYWL